MEVDQYTYVYSDPSESESKTGLETGSPTSVKEFEVPDIPDRVYVDAVKERR